jgi:hypothetical protein
MNYFSLEKNRKENIKPASDSATKHIHPPTIPSQSSFVAKSKDKSCNVTNIRRRDPTLHSLLKGQDRGIPIFFRIFGNLQEKDTTEYYLEHLRQHLEHGSHASSSSLAPLTVAWHWVKRCVRIVQYGFTHASVSTVKLRGTRQID